MQGIIAAVPTPVDENYVPIKNLFIEHCQWVLDNGCDGLNILGSTGEANSFDSATRQTIMTWAAENLDHSKLMVGTGTPSLEETITLTKVADDLDYSVALILPPYYYQPMSDDGLFEWYSKIHMALEDRSIQIYFYNFPQMTGIHISRALIQRLNAAYPNRFTGIKDSSGDLDYCRDLTSHIAALKVFPSSEVSLGEANQSNFSGCISATTNLTGARCKIIWQNKAKPDKDILEQIKDMRKVIAGSELIPSIKYLVAQRTKNEAWEKLVPPFQSVSDLQKNKLDTFNFNQ